MGAQRFKSPELLFKPDLYNPGVTGAVDESMRGVHELVYSAIQMADADLRRDLWGTICLAGGTTLTKGGALCFALVLPACSLLSAGFKERLERDLTNMSPAKVRVTASNLTVERKYSSWIGGSILASLGTFQQMWISKAEYDEAGAAICERKCP